MLTAQTGSSRCQHPRLARSDRRRTNRTPITDALTVSFAYSADGIWFDATSGEYPRAARCADRARYRCDRGTVAGIAMIVTRTHRSTHAAQLVVAMLLTALGAAVAAHK